VLEKKKIKKIEKRIALNSHYVSIEKIRKILRIKHPESLRALIRVFNNLDTCHNREEVILELSKFSRKRLISNYGEEAFNELVETLIGFLHMHEAKFFDDKILMEPYDRPQEIFRLLLKWGYEDDIALLQEPHVFSLGRTPMLLLQYNNRLWRKRLPTLKRELKGEDRISLEFVIFLRKNRTIIKKRSDEIFEGEFEKFVKHLISNADDGSFVTLCKFLRESESHTMKESFSEAVYIVGTRKRRYRDESINALKKAAETCTHKAESRLKARIGGYIAQLEKIS